MNIKIMIVIIILLLIGAVFIVSIGENLKFMKKTSEMALDKHDLPFGWEVSDYINRENEGYTSINFKNSFNNNLIHSKVTKWESDDSLAYWFKRKKREAENLIKKGSAYKIDTNVFSEFSENTKCFSHVVPFNKQRSSNQYVTNCIIKNIQFEVDMLTNGPINNDDKKLVVNLAKTIEKKVLS